MKTQYLEKRLQTGATATGVGEVLKLMTPGDGAFPRVGLQVTGITTATVTFEGSNDGANWYPVDLARSSEMETPINAATADGLYVGAVCCKLLRANITAHTSGAITVTAVASA